MTPVHQVTRTAWRDGTLARGGRLLPEETAIALTYNRVTHAVMMATPADLEDFAVGFSLAERIVTHPAQIQELEIVAAPNGIELRMTIPAALDAQYTGRRRALAGPTGCGLCGMESLDAAMRPPPPVDSDLCLPPAAITAAMMALPPRQPLNLQTRAAHAAGFWDPKRGLIAVREDVGRHNALDKLAGTLARRGESAAHGLLLLTSRVSVEMVQKAAAMGVPILAAVSAPTTLAVRTAAAAGITLVAIARADGFEVFTHPARIASDPDARFA